MRKLICLLAGFSLILLSAQKTKDDNNPYKEVDDYISAMKMPVITAKTMDHTAHLVTDKFSVDSMKIRAIYVFVARYYDYDAEQMKTGFGHATEDGLGFCWQYSQLFTDLCDAVGIK